MVHLKLRISADSLSSIKWFVDASHQTQDDCKGHTGAFLTFGKVAAASSSNKQKLNTKCSTETEIVALHDKSGDIIWMWNFLEAQGYTTTYNIIFQDNMSTLSLLKNGRLSNSKCTKHINAAYFFLQRYYTTDEIGLQYCPTKQMWADILTKPLQGSKFRQCVQFSWTAPLITPKILLSFLPNTNLLHPNSSDELPNRTYDHAFATGVCCRTTYFSQGTESWNCMIQNVPILRSKQVTWKDVTSNTPSPRPCPRDLYRVPVAVELRAWSS